MSSVSDRDPYPYTFTFTARTPDRLRVTVSVELPAFRASDRALSDAPELAQMAASNLVKRLEKLFEEMPF